MKTLNQIAIVLAIPLILFSCINSSDQGSTSDSGSGMDRTILPIQPPSIAPVTEMDARNVEKPEYFEVKAPEGAPNVVIVLIVLHLMYLCCLSQLPPYYFLRSIHY